MHGKYSHVIDLHIHEKLDILAWAKLNSSLGTKSWSKKSIDNTKDLIREVFLTVNTVKNGYYDFKNSLRNTEVGQ